MASKLHLMIVFSIVLSLLMVTVIAQEDDGHGETPIGNMMAKTAQKIGAN